MTPLNPHVFRLLWTITLIVSSTTVSFALSACGSSQSQTHTPVVSIEAQYQPIVDSFTVEAATEGAPVTITDLIIQTVQDLPTTEEMGVCLQGAGTTPTIQINQSMWDSLDADGQQELLFHELGHCVLNRVHEEILNNGVPVSVMSPIFLGSSLYDANKDQYMHELFTSQNISATLNMIIPQNALLPDFSTEDGNYTN
jgi:hypothetical protein